MTRRIIRVKKTLITFECSSCGNTHPDKKSAKICCMGKKVIFPDIDYPLQELVDDLVEGSYKNAIITPLYRNKHNA